MDPEPPLAPCDRPDPLTNGFGPEIRQRYLPPPPPLSCPTPCLSPGAGGGWGTSQHKSFCYGSLCCEVLPLVSRVLLALLHLPSLPLKGPNHHPTVLPKAFQWKVVSMCRSLRPSAAGPRNFTPSRSRSRSQYIGSPLNASYAEFFRFVLQFLCLKMCVYGGSAVPWGKGGGGSLGNRPPGGGGGPSSLGWGRTRGGVGVQFCCAEFRQTMPIPNVDLSGIPVTPWRPSSRPYVCCWRRGPPSAGTDGEEGVTPVMHQTVHRRRRRGLPPPPPPCPSNV